MCTQVVQQAFAEATPAKCDMSQVTLGQVVTQMIKDKSDGLPYVCNWLYK